LLRGQRPVHARLQPGPAGRVRRAGHRRRGGVARWPYHAVEWQQLRGGAPEWPGRSRTFKAPWADALPDEDRPPRPCRQRDQMTYNGTARRLRRRLDRHLRVMARRKRWPARGGLPRGRPLRHGALRRIGTAGARASTPKRDVAALSVIAAGQAFGELALMDAAARRLATVVALEPATTLEPSWSGWSNLGRPRGRRSARHRGAGRLHPSTLGAVARSAL